MRMKWLRTSSTALRWLRPGIFPWIPTVLPGPATDQSAWWLFALGLLRVCPPLHSNFSPYLARSRSHWVSIAYGWAMVITVLTPVWLILSHGLVDANSDDTNVRNCRLSGPDHFRLEFETGFDSNNSNINALTGFDCNLSRTLQYLLSSPMPTCWHLIFKINKVRLCVVRSSGKPSQLCLPYRLPSNMVDLDLSFPISPASILLEGPPSNLSMEKQVSHLSQAVTYTGFIVWFSSILKWRSLIL